MAYTEFYCTSIGSNLNSGSDEGSTPRYIISGTWNVTANTLTPTDGSNPVNLGVTVGDFVSIALPAATVAAIVVRVTAVASGVNGVITLSSSAKAGSNPPNGATTLRGGGAWKGMSSTTVFPFTLVNLGNLANLSGDPTRINLKGDQVYDLGNLSCIVQATEPSVIQAYSETPGDNGGANVQGSASPVWAHQQDGDVLVADIHFIHTATSGNGDLVNGGSSHAYWRCLFQNARGYGCSNGARSLFLECEFLNCNRSNTANMGCAEAFIDTTFLRCFFTDTTGSNGHGIIVARSGACQFTAVECIFDSLGGNAVHFWTQNPATTATVGARIINCDFYNNGGSGIAVTQNIARVLLYIENSNFLKNSRYAIDGGPVLLMLGMVDSSRFGSGTQANGLGNLNAISALQTRFTIPYPANLVPWVDPDNNNFNINSIKALGRGTGAFLDVDQGGTKGYPEIGASQTTPFFGGGGGGDGEAAGGAEVVEVPRPTIRVRDPEIAGLLRRARRAARTIEELSIVGDQVAGNSESGFSIGGGD